MAFGTITISIIWMAKSSLVDYLLYNMSAPSAPKIPLVLLIAAPACFLFGLVGLLIGCSCLPDGAGESRSRLCKALTGTGIGVSLAAIVIDFGLISVLRLFTEMP